MAYRASTFSSCLTSQDVHEAHQLCRSHLLCTCCNYCTRVRQEICIRLYNTSAGDSFRRMSCHANCRWSILPLMALGAQAQHRHLVLQAPSMLLPPTKVPFHPANHKCGCPTPVLCNTAPLGYGARCRPATPCSHVCGCCSHGDEATAGEELESLVLARRTNTMPLPGHASPPGDALHLTQRARAASLSAMPSQVPGALPSYQTALASVAGPASAMRPAGSPFTHQSQVRIFPAFRVL